MITNSIWHSLADIVVFLRDIPSTVALKPSLGLYLNQIKMLGGGEGSNNKVLNDHVSDDAC